MSIRGEQSPSATKVKARYSKLPYPYYPLIGQFHYSDAYLGLASFAHSLIGQRHERLNSPRVLIAGCGDSQPLLLRSIESKEIYIQGVDFSPTSIRRARWRLWLRGKHMPLVAEDLYRYCHEVANTKKKFHHIDCFGVLHHCAAPSKLLEMFHDCLYPGGTMRLMLYNRQARLPIQRAKQRLQAKGLDPESSGDVGKARKILNSLCQQDDQLAEAYKSIENSMASSHRFVDTFFHPLEVLLSVTKWWHLFAKTGFQVKGFFDRFHELNHLANPLYQVPKPQLLDAMSKTGEWRGNLEVYLQRSGEGSGVILGCHRSRLLRSGLPQLWRQAAQGSEELRVMVKLWKSFVDRMSGSEQVDDEYRELANCVSEVTRQRLARLGAFPEELGY